ncbi:unnamed protein product [Rotaria sp. Silwood1]|nr:unnamed protein product [Rotaria sp. Silwood1]CAF3825703.1 unnamed protein product [Rotaria sp. Silwood1]CAF3848062.1 unnamed protein product [Rotaria sp. Silwood1]CAF4596933.1 unnamed protein product [Rotaria sp. Silwood1]CAF4736607.1 unnamed protein product [Rotaria sp. Silwood1]
MVITTNHWVSSAMNNNTKTKYLIQFNHDYNNYSDISQEFKPIWISLSLISIIIFTVGGNSLVCIAVIRERHLQNTTNYFLTSLAFTDCLVACLVMPLAVTVEFIGHFPFDALACNVWSTFDVCCCTSSIWHMSVMSLDRYLTLRYPLKYGRNKRRSLMAYKIITIWLISFAICLPLFILSLVDSTNVFDEKAHACFPSNRIFKLYGSFVAFFIPLIIMIVTYALTMYALRQAHTTKKKRYKGRKKIHAVMNIAAMAVRWKRAVNNVEISSIEKQSTIIPEQDMQSSINKIPIDYAKRRATSLRIHRQSPKTQFTSNQRLNESLKLSSTSNWQKQSVKQLPETFIKQSVDQHLNPNCSNNLQAHTKRSHSCTPLLDVENIHNDQRRSSSIHTLLQIRRDSAKISEELANLTAQLSASMNNNNNNNRSTSKRPSLSVPGTTITVENDTPTIDQLLAETSVNQPIIIPKSLLSINPKRRQRSHSADIRLSIFDSNDDQNTLMNLPIPNLLVTHETNSNSPINNLQQSTPSLTFDKTCQRIKDWITTTTSSTVLNIDHDSTIPTRCTSAINITENTPMLTKHQFYYPHYTNLKRCYRGIEQLYGETTAPNLTTRQQQLLLVDDHVSSAQNFASTKRYSIGSIASSMLKARLLRHNRPSTTSSGGSSSLQGIKRQRPPRLIDGMSQASFQMVSLDTEDTSSCTSSLTQHSATLQSAIAGTNGSITSVSRKRRQRFKYLAKSSVGNERKAMRVLLIIFSIFVILWTPFFIINILSCFITDIHPILISIATWLGYCSSCANPIIYTIFSRAFRRAFFNILTCRKVIHSHRSSCHSMIMLSGRKFSSINKGHIDPR